jgi:putative endonuclease
MYTVYILRSIKHERNYYGHTNNLSLRLKKHNTGKVKSTKAYRPWTIIHTEQYKTKSEAYKREMFFKSIEGYKYLKKEGLL